mgnify:CR=1 FL=1
MKNKKGNREFWLVVPYAGSWQFRWKQTWSGPDILGLWESTAKSGTWAGTYLLLRKYSSAKVDIGMTNLFSYAVS